MTTKNDLAGAETVGALILFGIFVATIAFLNVTAVPQAGLAAEEAHFLDAVGTLNGLQAAADAAAIPGEAASAGILLGPTDTAGGDFFSFFVGKPAKASGELAFDASYGSVAIQHDADGIGTVHDVGSATTALPMGQVRFDPHPVFRNSGVAAAENGALVTTDGGSATLRYAPQISVELADGMTRLTIKTRILNGTSGSVGGGGPARVTLTTEASSMIAPAHPNAESVTLRLETAHGSAWGSHLNKTAIGGGLQPGASFTTTVARGAGASGLDVVTWRIEGVGTGNDIRFTNALSIMNVKFS